MQNKYHLAPPDLNKMPLGYSHQVITFIQYIQPEDSRPSDLDSTLLLEKST